MLPSPSKTIVIDSLAYHWLRAFDQYEPLVEPRADIRLNPFSRRLKALRDQRALRGIPDIND